MLQVQDMEFELVRPNFFAQRSHHFQAARTSEDSGVLGREGLSLDLGAGAGAGASVGGPGRGDAGGGRAEGFLRAESPAFSVVSSGGLSGQRSPTIEGGASGSGIWSSAASNNNNPLSPPPPPPAHAPLLLANTDSTSESSMDAHRQRELKWMSLISSSSSAPASSAQTRKSKKVRRLLVDGVPSSVRYLVWSFLTDGKARCVPGVYEQLCMRGAGRLGEGVREDMERDVRVWLGREEHLRGRIENATTPPVLGLLTAYLNMVPDVQYSMGLTLIVGQLLLLSPEEDAFWIFVSIMDTHIRPYFSSTTTQMEVDAALFSRALENNDAQVARKLLVDMGILPGAMCQPWFSTLFVGTLPPEYLNRVWDLFLFEGVPFLLRVALALVSCCRRRLLESTSDDAVLQLLRRPPAALLPPTPDAFLALAFAVKLKDDDMRKQRVKMEAQVKRQTQVPRTASTSGMISLPRT
ncbi:rab-GTPase-TBC domain-containing protein [Flammula alnicola]|nr:rab-GTPase-TBC domain-containing protein [Flammula alnicola]